MAELGTLYSRDFYRGQSPTSSSAAAAILPPVVSLVRPVSMIDVGCGVGTWLAAAERIGVRRLVGIEGPWVTSSDLESSSINLITHNLEQPISVGDRFDLAMSVEVAEHISQARADSLVGELCALAPVVLFGAAIPGQGGVHHVNEEWQSRWALRFAARDFRVFDIVRGRFWGDASIPVHYRQNTLLYVHQEHVARLENNSGGPLPEPWVLDVVHPEVQLANVDALTELPTLGQSVRIALGIPGAAIRSVRSRIAQNRERPQ
jgi:hypothetical protein